MDKLENYRQMVKQVVGMHANYPSDQDYIDTLAVCDEQTDNYLLLDIEASETGYKYWVIFHLRISDEKVGIEKDGIECGIARDLVDVGIPKEDINLDCNGFKGVSLSDFVAA